MKLKFVQLIDKEINDFLLALRGLGLEADVAPDVELKENGEFVIN